MRIFLAVVSAVFLHALPAAAQQVVHVKSVEVEPAKVAAGDMVTLSITVKVDPPWHIYAPDEENDAALATSVDGLPKFLDPLGDLSAEEEAQVHEMPGLGEIHYYEGETVFTMDLFVDIDAPTGKVSELGELSFQPCTKEKCLRPDALPLDVELEIIEAAEPAPAPGNGGGNSEPPGGGSGAWKDGEVRVEAEIWPWPASVGDELELKITAGIAPGWHIYAPDERNPNAVPTTLSISSLYLEPVGPLKALGEADEHEMIGVGTIHYFEDEVTLAQKVRLKELPGEAAEITEIDIGELAFMTCTMEVCLQPDSVDVTAVTRKTGSFEVDPDGVEVTAPGEVSETPSGTTPEDERLKASIDHGLLAFMGVCALFALLALLTPCVYPMIPITVSYFTKAKHASKGEAFSHALAYGLGMVITYVGFGVGVRALLGDQGPTVIAVNGWVNTAVAGIFIVFGLSLLGMFDLALPSSWVNGLNKVAGRSTGYLGDLLMGFAFTLAAFTCTVPIVGIILRLGVEVSNFHMFLGMLTYATVFAAPFFVLALVPSMVKSMPKSGGWLNNVKVVLAFIELAAAFKFLSAADFYFTGPPGTLFTFTVVVLSWAVLMILTGVYLLGGFRFVHDSPTEHIGAMKMLVAAAFLVFGLYLVGGAFGKPIAPWIASLAPPQEETAGDEPWEIDPQHNSPAEWELARAHALENGKPIFLEFSGFT